MLSPRTRFRVYVGPTNAFKTPTRFRVYVAFRVYVGPADTF